MSEYCKPSHGDIWLHVTDADKPAETWTSYEWKSAEGVGDRWVPIITGRQSLSSVVESMSWIADAKQAIKDEQSEEESNEGWPQAERKHDFPTVPR